MAFQVQSREYVLLGLLVVVVIGYLYYSVDSGAGPDEGDTDAKLASAGNAPVVNMAALMRDPEGYDAEGRSLFKYYTPPPPKAAPVVRPPTPEIKRPPLPPPRKPQNTAPKAPPAPRPPQINFTYLGYLGPKEDRIAVFENPEGMTLARAGDVVHDEFRVVEFKYETIVMGYTDGRFSDRTTELTQENR